RAAVGVAQIDTAGRYRLVNDRYCELMQRPAAELLQMRMQDLSDPGDLADLVDRLGRAIHGGESVVTETRLLLPDGTRVWSRHNVAPLSEEGDAVGHLVAMAEDVTARRHAEEDLQRAHSDLQLTIQERTATLKKATEVLHAEIEQRKRVETALKLD